MSLRERKKEDTHRRILETANEMFRARGFEETRVAEIARAVQVSEKTVFNYFPSKEAILSELALKWFMQHELLVDASPDVNGAGNLLDAWKHRIRTRLRKVEEERDFMSMVVRNSNILQSYYGKQEGKSAEGFAAALRRDAANKAEMFRQAQRLGSLRNDVSPEELVLYYDSIRSAIVTDWLSREDSQFGELEERVLRAVDILLTGMLLQSNGRTDPNS